MKASTPVNATPSYIDKRWFIRLLEIIPGTITWATLALPIVLSFVQPILVAYFIISYDLYWMVKSFRLSINLLRGYRRMHLAQSIDWNARLAGLHDVNKEVVHNQKAMDLMRSDYPALGKWFYRGDKKVGAQYEALKEEHDRLVNVAARTDIMNPDELYHAVILATYNESLDTLWPSVKSLTEVDFPLKQLMLVIAYEERGGAETEANAHKLVAEFGDKFALAMAVKHPDGIVGEVRGKGGNISFAGRVLTAEIGRRKIDPERVIVTTFDSDHRSSKNYFSYLSYLYAIDSNRVHRSYQPIPMFYNNIWDAPAPMRVIATGNSFWMLMETMRPHRLRNFAAHAQSLAALIQTDYWSVSSIVEDGHQYWRSYFAFDGDHEVVPVFTPIYQDAVLATTYARTFKVQFLQLRRWAWGVSDFPFVVRKAIANPRIPWSNKLPQIGRLFESHFSWATAPLILTFVGGLPLYLNRNFGYESIAHTLPIITSRILTLSSTALVVTVLLSLLSLPPKPARYRRTRFIGMLLQWVLLPVVTICFGAFAALNSQTRLMFGRYLEFYVTEKATKK
jgi:hypothetical protein